MVVHSVKENNWCSEALKRTGFDYRLLKWFFVILLS